GNGSILSVILGLSRVHVCITSGIWPCHQLPTQTVTVPLASSAASTARCGAPGSPDPETPNNSTRSGSVHAPRPSLPGSPATSPSLLDRLRRTASSSTLDALRSCETRGQTAVAERDVPVQHNDRRCEVGQAVPIHHIDERRPPEFDAGT